MFKKLLFFVCIFCFFSCFESNPQQTVEQEHAQDKATIINSPEIKKANFNYFLKELSQPDNREKFTERVKNYFPDSVLYNGQDIFGHEIPFTQQTKIVFFENSGDEKAPSNVHLASFTNDGNNLDIIQLKEVSFDGSIAVNYLTDHIFEIEYYDFYPMGKSPRGNDWISGGAAHALPMGSSSSRRSSKDKIVEDFYYEYYRVDDQGHFHPIRGAVKISEGRQFPQASYKILSTEELQSYPKRYIERMEQEIYADHGLIYHDNKFRRYFRTKKWYKPRHENIYLFLNEIELINLAKIKALIQQKAH